MEMRSRISPVFALLLATSFLTGCSKSSFTSSSRKDVVFTAETQTETKVAYSGIMTDNIERIDWKKNDRIRIFSNKALTWKRDGSTGNPQATYIINEDSITPVGRYSRASVKVVESANEGGLQWDEGVDEHIFLALYPDQMPSGASSFEPGPAGQRFPCYLSTVQPHSQSGVFDMHHAYLFARTTVNYKSSGNAGVKLSFYPLFTAFEFRLVDGENNTPTLKKLELISNKTICGREKWTAMYQYDYLDWAYDSTYGSGENHKAVIVDNINANLPVMPANGNPTPKIVQLFGGMNTDVAHELTLRLTFGDDDVRELDLKQNGQWIQYPRGKKGVFNILVKNKSMSFTYSCQAIDLTHVDVTDGLTW